MKIICTIIHVQALVAFIDICLAQQMKLILSGHPLSRILKLNLTILA